ncbi:MAG: hypothetical protein J5949_08610, partial [Oscillospiraceae bacterium]|nr:hypothetical protein [Oscillospiraceae bacterium]
MAENQYTQDLSLSDESLKSANEMISRHKEIIEALQARCDERDEVIRDKTQLMKDAKSPEDKLVIKQEIEDYRKSTADDYTKWQK